MDIFTTETPWSAATFSPGAPRYGSGRFIRSIGVTVGETLKVPSAGLVTALAGSFEAWARLDSVTGGLHVICDVGGTGLSGLIFGVNSAGKLLAQHFPGGGMVQVIGTTILQPATWYHVAMTWDASAVTVFLNGRQEATGVGVNGMVPLSMMGLGLVASGSYHLSGWIESARYATVRRSAAEVWQSYFTGIRLDDRSSGLFFVPSGGDAVLLRAGNGLSVQFSRGASPGSEDGGVDFRQLLRHDSAGDVYVYRKSSMEAAEHVLAFHGLSPSSVAGLELFQDAAARGTKNLFTWFDQSGLSHTVRFDKGGISPVPRGSGWDLTVTLKETAV